MRYFALFTVMAVLTGCSWETYKNSQGQTALRQKYPTGTAVSYEEAPHLRYRTQTISRRAAGEGSASCAWEFWMSGRIRSTCY